MVATAPNPLRLTDPKDGDIDLGLNVPSCPWILGDEANNLPDITIPKAVNLEPSRLNNSSVGHTTIPSALTTTTTTHVAADRTSMLAVLNSNTNVGSQQISGSGRLRLPANATSEAMTESIGAIRQNIDELLKRAPSTGCAVSVAGSGVSSACAPTELASGHDHTRKFK